MNFLKNWYTSSHWHKNNTGKVSWTSEVWFQRYEKVLNDDDDDKRTDYTNRLLHSHRRKLFVGDKKIHIVLLPSTYVNCLSPVKYYYKNNRQRVVKVNEFFWKLVHKLLLTYKQHQQSFIKFWSLVPEIWEGFKQTNKQTDRQTNKQTTYHCYFIVTDENCSSGTNISKLRLFKHL